MPILEIAETFDTDFINHVCHGLWDDVREPNEFFTELHKQFEKNMGASELSRHILRATKDTQFETLYLTFQAKQNDAIGVASCVASPGTFHLGRFVDDIVILHGTRIEFSNGGGVFEGVVSDMYLLSNLNEGSELRVRVGPFQSKRKGHGTFFIKPHQVNRIVKNSHWEHEYLKKTG